MAYHEKASTKHQRGAHIGQSRNSEESLKFENRSDRDESYNSHGSFRTSREERTQQRGYPQKDRDTDRRRHYDHASDKSNHYAESEDRVSGLVMKDHWTWHDRLKINSHRHERVGGAFYERESSNRDHNISYTANQGGRPIRRQEYDRKDDHADSRKIVHGRQHHRDNKYHQKSHDNYKHKEEEQQYEEAQSPAWAHSSASDVTSMKVTRKDRGNSDDLDEQRRQYPSTADRRSEQRHVEHWHHNSSHERPSSRGSSLSSVSDDADDPRDIDRLRDIRRSRSPSHSGSRPRSESRHRGRGDSRSPSGNHSGTQKYSRSSHGRTHSGKRKHKDRSASREDRKRRKHKEKEREKAKEMSREKEKIRKRDDERRSVLTGKKIKLKVKKDKGDHERDANRKDLLQFLNSAFE